MLIAVGLCAAAYSCKTRYSAEARNRAVELMIDWPDAQALANTRSRAIDEVLTQLKAAGITTVAVSEETLETLHGSGIVNYTRVGDNTIVSFAPGFAGQEVRVINALKHKTKLTIVPQASDQYMIDAPWPQFNGTPIGLDDDIVRTVRRNNLLVAPRLFNYTGVTADNIYWELAQAKQQCGPGGLGPFVFTGAAVLGYRGRIDDTAHAFDKLDLTYGSVEFAKTFGDDDLSRAAAAHTVRVHSIGLDEIGDMDEPTAVERFTRAVRERNIRVCYVRLFVNGLDHEPDAENANTQFVQKIVAGITLAGLKVEGPAHPFRNDPSPGRILRLAMAVGVAAGVVCLILAFTGWNNPRFWLMLAAALVIALGLAWPSSTAKGREILALFAACSFPTLALCGRPIRIAEASRNRVAAESTGRVLARAFLEYVRITGITMIGILFVVGLLNGRLFFLKIDEFLGVKMVLIAPLLLVSSFYCLGLADLPASATLSERCDTALARLRGIGATPLSAGLVIVSLVTLAAIVLIVARSGNDPGVAVSDTELRVRAILDRTLGVRPRTKEFLFGNPALLVGVALALSGRSRKWLSAWLICGAIGQSSMLDTFCHLHTPLQLSFMRDLIGWILGGIIGAIVYTVLSRYIPAEVASPGAPERAGAAGTGA